jgi:hypothetical protein
MFHVKHKAKAHPHLAWGWAVAAGVSGDTALGATQLFGSALLGKKKSPPRRAGRAAATLITNSTIFATFTLQLFGSPTLKKNEAAGSSPAAQWAN